MPRSIVAVLLLCLLGACSAQAPRPDVSPSSGLDEPACIARGGQWRQLGRAPVPQCLLATADAGNACTDNAQCEGLCLAAEGSVDGAAAVGSCSVDSNRFGCRQQLRDGTAFTLCID